MIERNTIFLKMASALEICCSRDWARPIPSHIKWFSETNIIPTHQNPFILTNGERVAQVQLSKQNAWEISSFYPFDITKIYTNRSLLFYYSVQTLYKKRLEQNWKRVAIILKRISEQWRFRHLFQHWKRMTAPQISHFTSKQKRWCQKRIIRRSFYSWKTWIHYPLVAQTWLQVPKTGWKVIRDVPGYWSILARTYVPYKEHFYVLDSIFFIIGPGGKRWTIQSSDYHSLIRLSELPDTKQHIWGVVRACANWQRYAVLKAERRSWAISYIYIHTLHTVWNDVGIETVRFRSRLERLKALHIWRIETTKCSQWVEEFCKIFYQNQKSPDQTSINAKSESFVDLCTKMYQIHTAFSGHWIQDLKTVASKDKRLQSLYQKQYNFIVFINGMVESFAELIKYTERRNFIDKCLDPELFQMSIWGNLYFNIEQRFLGQPNEFKTHLQEKMATNMEHIRFGFQWNTQKMLYRKEGPNPIIYTIMEFSSLHIKPYEETSIRIVELDVQNLIQKLEYKTKLPFTTWIQSLCR